MKQKFLSSFALFAVRKNSTAICILAVLVFISIYGAAHLELSMRWSDLLPENEPMAKEFNRITSVFHSDSNIIVVLQGNETDIKHASDRITEEIRKLTFIKRVKNRIEEDFYKKHGAMLSRKSSLDSMYDSVSNLSLPDFLNALNNNFETTYLEGEPLGGYEKRTETLQALGGIDYFLHSVDTVLQTGEFSPVQAEKTAQMLALGETYYVSSDNDTLLIIAEPDFSATDTEKCVLATEQIQKITDQTIAEYPGVIAGLAGTIPLLRDELVFSEHDMKISSVITMVLVFGLSVFFFRMLSLPLIAALNLVLSIICAAGVISLCVDSLNIMTSMFAAILMGLGIDFSIHIIALYLEARSAKKTVEESLIFSLTRTGPGIITGGITTSAAFFTLAVSDTRGIKEMGIVLGSGIIVLMAATLVFLPVLLVLSERLRSDKKKNTMIKSRFDDFKLLENSTAALIRRKKTWGAVWILITAFLLWQAVHAEFDYNYLNMEPEGIPSVVLQDVIVDKFDLSPDFVMVTVKSIEDARSLCKTAKKLDSVGSVDSISEYIPSDEQYSRRIPVIEKIRNRASEEQDYVLKESDISRVIDELTRLEMNIIEIGQLAYTSGQDRIVKKADSICKDKKAGVIQRIIQTLSEDEHSFPRISMFQDLFFPELRAMYYTMSSTDKITEESLPETIRSRYVSEDTSDYLVTLNSRRMVWDFKFLNSFAEQMSRLNMHITGMPLMFLRLIDLTAADGKFSTLLALLVIFIILWVDFKNPFMALAAMIPLVVGTVWMVGIMRITGFYLTFVNAMAVPMIIGIGIDDGVHVIHRLRTEGAGKMQHVMKSTGKAILLTSLTTAAGFGSLLIAQYRGFISLAVLMVYGVFSCFAATVIFLPLLPRRIFDTHTENCKNR